MTIIQNIGSAVVCIIVLAIGAYRVRDDIKYGGFTGDIFGEMAWETCRLSVKCLLIDLGAGAFIWIVLFFSPDTIKAVVNKVFDSVFFGFFWGFLFSIVIMLFGVLVYNGIMVPIRNYTTAVRKVYGIRKWGKIYSFVYVVWEKLLLSAIAIFVVALCIPYSRKRIVLCRDFPANSLECITENTYYQNSKKFLEMKDYFYDDWYIQYDNRTDSYVKVDDDTAAIRNGTIELDTVCNYKVVENRLIGVAGEHDIVLASAYLGADVKLSYEWKKNVQKKDGTYDYDKIYAIFERQKTEKISYYDVATIIGLIEERVIVGVSPYYDIIFMEKSGEEAKFLKKTKKGCKTIGTYGIDPSKDVTYWDNEIYFTEPKGGLQYVSCNTGEKVSFQKSEVMKMIHKKFPAEKVKKVAFSANEGKDSSDNFMLLGEKNIYYYAPQNKIEKMSNDTINVSDISKLKIDDIAISPGSMVYHAGERYYWCNFVEKKKWYMKLIGL